jgi:hypothetical protein
MKRDLTQIDQDFIKFCIEELELQTSPVIKIGDDHQKAQQVRAMGYYSPVDNEIWVLRGQRVPADWYRTLAHELVHWRQRELGQVMDGSDGSELENEANSKAAVLLREWGRRHEEIYVLDQDPLHGPGQEPSPRTEYYTEYYSNLTPSDFTVSTVGDEVRILIPPSDSWQ